MIVPARAARPFLLLLLAPLAAQAPETLSLATVLARGQALQAPLPRVLWLPGGHEATVVLTAADGNQVLHRFADGKPVDPPICDA
ncbi:MAG: hypothetical protein FJ265_19480, partial [Planctomycetes bacterium]|nr:hypothetical protein [Planctomycetota bacterium]